MSLLEGEMYSTLLKSLGRLGQAKWFLSLEDWDLARVALSCHLALDLLCQEMQEACLGSVWKSPPPLKSCDIMERSVVGELDQRVDDVWKEDREGGEEVVPQLLLPFSSVEAARGGLDSVEHLVPVFGMGGFPSFRY